MPLMHGSSKKAFQKNVETEMHAHPGRRAQNLAIAYATKRMAQKGRKMADGGEVGRGSTKTYQSQSEREKGVHTSRNIGGPSKEKFGESSAGYAARASHSSNPDIQYRDMHTGQRKTVTPNDFSEQAKREHEKVREEASQINPDIEGLAMGGDVDDTNEKLHPRHEMIREHMSLVNRMLDSGDRGYAMGGMAGHEQSEYEKEGNIMDESEAHEGLHDVDDPFDHNSQHFPTDMFSEDDRMNSDMSDEEKTKKKRYQAMRDAMGM